MIKGIGVDCIEIARVEKSMQKDTFVQRVFSAEERALFAGKGGGAAQSAAACFAAKEAFLKATATGLGGFALDEIAALRHSSGAPYYAFSGRAMAHMQQQGLVAHLSLSHDNGMAVAFCVLETDKGET